MAGKYGEHNKVRCSFCNKSEDQVRKLIAGPEGVYICDECIEICAEIMDEELDEYYEQDENQSGINLMKPKEITAFLDDYVIGQEEAKKALAVAVYNHYKRITVGKRVDGVELQKSNILMLGPTGSGKTLLAQTLAKMLNVPFAIADATTLTEAGYVGEDVENILLKLIQAGRKHPHQELLQIDTTNILFICGGAFEGMEKVIEARLDQKEIGFNSAINDKRGHNVGEILRQVLPQDFVKFGMIPEIIGRVPMVVSLDQLDRDALIRILKEPKNSIIKQYQKLFEMDGVELSFADDAVEEVADKTLERKTGARGLRAIMEKAMLDIMYTLPSDENVDICLITKDVIDGSGEPVLMYSDDSKLPSTKTKKSKKDKEIEETA